MGLGAGLLTLGSVLGNQRHNVSHFVVVKFGK